MHYIYLAEVGKRIAEYQYTITLKHANALTFLILCMFSFMECTFPSCFEIILCSSKHFIFACKFHLIPFVIANQLAGYCPTVCISFVGSNFFCVSCTFRKRPKGNNLLEHVTEKTQTDIEINVHNLYLENEARHTDIQQ